MSDELDYSAEIELEDVGKEPEPTPEPVYDAKSAIEERDRQIESLRGDIEALRQMGQPVAEPTEKKTLWDMTDVPVDEFKGGIANDATELAVKVVTAKQEMIAEFDAATVNVPDNIRNELRKSIVNADAKGTLIAHQRGEHKALAEMALGRAFSQGHMPTAPVQRAESGSAGKPKVTPMADDEKQFFELFKNGFGVTEEQWRNS